MTKSNHAPLPWQQGIKNKKLVLGHPNCHTPAVCHTEEDAALIVHRVNNWDKLIEALEFYAGKNNYIEIVKGIPHSGGQTKTSIFLNDQGEKAKAALTLAKEPGNA